MDTQEIFKTIPKKNYLSFFGKNEKEQNKKVLELLHFKNNDAAKAARIPIQSVRFDDRMPQSLSDRIQEWAIAIGLVSDYFNGDLKKVSLWFRIPNPMFGNMAPRDMIRFGKFKRLLQFIQTALQESH